MIPFVTRDRLSKLAIGESVIVTERPSNRNAGASVQSYASRAGIKVETKQCFIVIPSDERMEKAVCVTRTQ